MRPFHFQPPGAYQTTFIGAPQQNGFVTKFNGSGSALVYSTFLGGSRNDYGVDITLDSAGNAYVTGVTFSNNFPTSPGAYDTLLNDAGAVGPQDAFVTKLNASGSQLVYSTYLGGRGQDYGTGIALMASNAYVTGHTDLNPGTGTNNFPVTAGAYDVSPNGQDAFVTKLNASGSAPDYSTYLGGSNSDGGSNIFNSTGCHIAVDSFGNAYVTGSTLSSDFPTTPGAYDTLFNSVVDSFVTKLNATGTQPLLYSTFLGSKGSDHGHGIALDSARNVYVTGQTDNGFSAPNFPTSSGAYDTTYNGQGDAFVAKLTGADLQVSKTDSPDPITAGSTLTYTITVKNNGPLGATGVNLTDSLPRRLLCQLRQKGYALDSSYRYG